ncbi:MAG: protein kinase domain-containing protein [Planctomycetaceae bacterium]
MSPAAELDRLWAAGVECPPVQAVSAIISGSADGQQLLSLMRLDQQRRWRSGRPLLVEDYLRAWGQVPAGVDWSLELLAGECLSRSESDAELAVEVSVRFPQYSDLLCYLLRPAVFTDVAELRAALCVRLEKLYEDPAGQPRLEYLLAGVAPELRRDVFPDLMRTELRCQQQRGLTVVPEALQRRFPGYEAEVRQLFGLPATGQADILQQSQQTLVPGDGSGHAAAEAAVVSEPICGRLGDYELLGELGRGGMGVVYRARQCSLNRLVALKTVIAGTGAGREDILRFRNEAEAAANLRHPGIVGVYEVGESEGRHFYSMEFIEGHDLSRLIRQNSLPGEQAAACVRQLADAVQYAHERGVLHRDLKPQNVLVDALGVLRITDFGLAKRVQADSQLTGDFSIMGTPSYMPPEQADPRRGRAGPCSDIYSLGAVLYELLTTRPPFRADNPLETMRQVLHEEPIAPRLLNPRIALDLQTICLKCLEKEPSRRYDSAKTLSDELTRFLEGRPILARPLGRLQRLWRLCRRHPRESMLTGLVLSAIVLGAAGVGWQWQRAEANLQRATRNFDLLGRAADEMLVVVEEWVTRTPPRSEAQQQKLYSSLKLFETFLQEEPANRTAQMRLAETHLRVAEIRRLLRQQAQASHHYREAVRIYHELNESGPDAGVQLALAGALDWLGNMEREAERHEVAAAAFEEALKIQRKLVAGGPSAQVLGALAKTLYNRGLLRMQNRDPGGAESDFGESIAASERALLEEPASTTFRQGLARCRLNLGVLLKSTGRSADSLRECDGAIQLLQQLVTEQPGETEYLLELAQVQLNRGNLLFTNRQLNPPLVTDSLKVSAEAFAVSVQLLEALQAEYPNVPEYHIQLANALNGLGGAEQEQQQSELAARSWQRARLEFERVLKLSGESADIRSRLGLVLFNLALQVPKDQPQEKIVLLEEACVQQRKALEKTPEAQPIQNFLRTHLLSLSRTSLLAGQQQRAASAAEELAELELQPGDWRLAAELLLRCGAAEAAEAALADAGRTEQVVDYQNRAVSLLKRGLVKGAVTAESLRGDEKLRVLQENPRFLELLEAEARD